MVAERAAPTEFHRPMNRLNAQRFEKPLHKTEIIETNNKLYFEKSNQIPKTT